MPGPEDQTANLNRCLFFITPLISYATLPPPFYSEFRLHCCECMHVRVYPSRCIRVLARISVYLRIHIDSFLSSRIRNGLSSLRRLASFSSPPATPAGVPSFLRVYYDPILLSTYYYPGMHRKSLMHVYLPHVFVYLLDQFTLKVPSDESSRKCGEPRTHKHDRSTGKLLLSRESRDNFALDSRERRTERFESG